MLKIVKRIPGVKAAGNGFRARLWGALSVVSPTVLASLRYREAWGRWPDLRNPVTFDEKLLWLNLYWRHPLKVECGEKLGMRRYAERVGLGSLLPELFAVFNSVDEVDFERLPDRFVLKCTHGCKCNVFCEQKSSLDTSAVLQQLRQWMRTDYSRIFGEWHYGEMPRRIICEEYLSDGTGRLPTDYKVYCFNGRALWVLCCYDRVPNGKANLAVFDTDWNPVTFYRDEPGGRRAIPCPSSLSAMLTACNVLAAPFPFVRVDFYSIRGRPVLGELTFTPDACIDRTYTEEIQLEMGRSLELPKPWR